jgi:hypothetical protein
MSIYYYLQSILFVCAVSISSAFACSCALITPAEAYASADTVFSGKVENVQYLDDPEGGRLEPRIIVTFSVNDLWKGGEQSQIIMHTVYNKFSCNGYFFKSGKEYLVYATYNKRAENFLGKLFAPKEPRLGVKLCSGTKPIEEAGSDLTVLRSSKGLTPGKSLKNERAP